MNLCKMLSLNLEEASDYCLKRVPDDFSLDQLRFPIIDHEGRVYNFKHFADLKKFASFNYHPVTRSIDYVEYHKYPQKFLESYSE